MFRILSDIVCRRVNSDAILQFDNAVTFKELQTAAEIRGIGWSGYEQSFRDFRFGMNFLGELSLQVQSLRKE